MIELTGISIQKLPYTALEFVGVLLFSEYPSTIVYKDESNLPVIKEWVDCSEDNKIDRYFYYSVSKVCLKKFIAGTLSHLDLINSAKESYVFFQDETGNKKIQTNIVSIKSIPKNYLPDSDFLFEIDDGQDTQIIANHFELNSIEILKEQIPYKVKQTSVKANSETLYIHLKEGKGIGYGSIKTEILGNALTCIDGLYKSIALDYLEGKDRGDIYLDAKKNQQYLTYTDTEVYGEKIAASYGFMLRPIHSQISNFEVDKTPASHIAAIAFKLINRSKNTEELKEEYILHSKFTVNLYEEFLQEIYKQELNMDLNWFNPKNNSEMSTTLDYLNANKIIEEIKVLSFSEKVNIKVKGKFRSINCDTAHFTFMTTNAQNYIGYFDKLIEDTISRINFIDVYEISIDREITKKPGKEDKISDSIISCLIEKPI